MATADYTVKIQRKMFPQTYMGRVRSQFKSIDKDMFLPEQVRWNMAGEAVIFYEIQQEGDKITFIRPAAKPSSWTD